MAVTTPSSDNVVPRPPASWPVWLAAVCLSLVALPFAVRGISAWRDDDLVRQAAIRFFREVAAGRKEAALSCLSEDYRSALTREEKTRLATPWHLTEGVDIRVLSVERQADSVAVRLSIAKSGFSLRPTVRLQRSHDGAWRIVEIEGNDVDPRWLRRQEREAREAEESLADELAKKLDLPPPERPAAP